MFANLYIYFICLKFFTKKQDKKTLIATLGALSILANKPITYLL